MESSILGQLKKAQGETNERLDDLVNEQRRTNHLLTQLLAALAASSNTEHVAKVD